jgi:uncharacterized protein YjbJ (UPF0337 family)
MADDLTGKIKHVGGKLQEGAGELLGDSQLAEQGRLSQVEGEAEQDQARAEDEAVRAATRKQAAKTAKELNKK